MSLKFLSVLFCISAHGFYFYLNVFLFNVWSNNYPIIFSYIKIHFSQCFITYHTLYPIYNELIIKYSHLRIIPSHLIPFHHHRHIIINTHTHTHTHTLTLSHSLSHPINTHTRHSGYGEVYRALQRRTGRPVAYKIIKQTSDERLPKIATEVGLLEELKNDRMSFALSSFQHIFSFNFFCSFVFSPSSLVCQLNLNIFNNCSFVLLSPPFTYVNFQILIYTTSLSSLTSIK